MFTCHSGGCEGSDMAWELIGKEYGVRTLSYSFYNHVCHGENPIVLTLDELKEGFEQAKLCESILHRPLTKIIDNNYVKNLISRNWFQVKNSDKVLAVGTFQNYTDVPTVVDGGTGWAIQMAINRGHIPIYVFEQTHGVWYRWDETFFVPVDYTPTITRNFAGIGTRKLSEYDMLAISNVYEKSFETVDNKCI